MAVPVLDFHELESQSGLNQLDLACRNWGAFQVVNHGISESLLDDVQRVTEEFFSQNTTIYEKSSMGLEGFGTFFNPSGSQSLDWGQAMFFFIPPSPSTHWPLLPTTYRTIFSTYANEVKKLVNKLLYGMSLALGLEPRFLQDISKLSDFQGMRLNDYPPCSHSNSVFGLRPHSDGTGLTVLLQNKVDGLEVMKDGTWHLVNFLPHALVVNIGDHLEILTNGEYQSVEHRATVHKSRQRFSVATFHCPPDDFVMAPIKSLTTSTRPSMFTCITVKEFRMAYRKQPLNGKNHMKIVKYGDILP